VRVQFESLQRIPFQSLLDRQLGYMAAAAIGIQNNTTIKLFEIRINTSGYADQLPTSTAAGNTREISKHLDVSD
jgi:hypothetical protein